MRTASFASPTGVEPRAVRVFGEPEAGGHVADVFEFGGCLSQTPSFVPEGFGVYRGSRWDRGLVSQSRFPAASNCLADGSIGFME